MTKAQIIITLVLGVITNLISAGLLAILKWQLKKLALPSDLPGMRERFLAWFYSNLGPIVLAGLILDVSLLAWLLLKFPTVTVWTVLLIVLSVAVMAFQLAIYIFIKVLQSILNWMLRGLTKLGEPDAIVADNKPLNG
jgi:hypothetical protein